MLVLILANVYFFLNGINLSMQISSYDSNISLLKDQNTELERKGIAASSYTRAQDLAKQLNFTKQASPVYIETMVVAKNF